MSAILGWDVDDTFLDFVNPVLDFHYSVTGRRIHYDKFVEYDLSKVDDLSHMQGQEIFDRFHVEGCFNQLPPLREAQEHFPRIKDKAVHKLITARGPEYEGLTLYSIHQHFGFRAAKYRSAREFERDWSSVPINKAKIAVEENVDFFIEDSPKNALAVAEAGIPVLMPFRPWNTNVKHPKIRKGSWKEIVDFLDVVLK